MPTSAATAAGVADVAIDDDGVMVMMMVKWFRLYDSLLIIILRY